MKTSHHQAKPTVLYLVRHAESLYVEGANRTRGLSVRGRDAALKVEKQLIDKEIDLFISSPYLRAVDTIQPLAKAMKHEIILIEDLRERTLGRTTDEFLEAKRKLYKDKAFSFPDGESSLVAQERIVKVMESILITYPGKDIVMGTHGDIMTLLLNHYDSQFDYDFWKSITMPDIYRLEFLKKDLKKVTRLWQNEE